MIGRPHDKESQPKTGPSLYEERCAWAAEGNIEALWNALLNRPRVMRASEMHQLLHQAIEKRAQDDPEQFAEHMYRRMTGFTAVLVYKAHWLMTGLLRGHDQAVEQFNKDPSACTDVLAMIPHLIELQMHLLELQQGHAATQRLRELARVKQLANDAGKGRKRRPRPKRRKGSSPRPSPVVPVNRLAGLMESLNGHDHSDDQSAN